MVRVLVIAQIRAQMSGPEISRYEKSILGCGLWSGLEKKWSGPIMSNFWGPFFQFSGSKFFFENTLASALKSCMKPFFLISKFFLSPDKVKKPSFLRAKNLSVNTWMLGPDICSLICGHSQHSALAKIGKPILRVDV